MVTHPTLRTLDNDPIRDLAEETVDRMIMDGRLNERLRDYSVQEMVKELSRSCTRHARRAGRNLDFALTMNQILAKQLGLRLVG